jgi:hypothetical protein
MFFGGSPIKRRIRLQATINEKSANIDKINLSRAIDGSRHEE